MKSTAAQLRQFDKFLELIGHRGDSYAVGAIIANPWILPSLMSSVFEALFASNPSFKSASFMKTHLPCSSGGRVRT
jgi:hypothetical protein